MAAQGLANYLAQLRLSLQQPPDQEPDVDQKELGVEDAVKFRCGPASVLKARYGSMQDLAARRDQNS